MLPITLHMAKFYVLLKVLMKNTALPVKNVTMKLSSIILKRECMTVK